MQAKDEAQNDLPENRTLQVHTIREIYSLTSEVIG